MADTRGSWTIDEGVIRRWELENLDAEFRAYWSDPSAMQYSPLNDGEARPTPPGPYCVYEKQIPIVEGHDSGRSSATTNQSQRVTVQFTIHAKSTAALSGKAIAKALAEKVCAAFDPDRGPLDIAPDSLVETIRGADWHIREGDQEWAWVVTYDYVIDSVYDTPA